MIRRHYFSAFPPSRPRPPPPPQNSSATSAASAPWPRCPASVRVSSTRCAWQRHPARPRCLACRRRHAQSGASAADRPPRFWQRAAGRRPFLRPSRPEMAATTRCAVPWAWARSCGRRARLGGGFDLLAVNKIMCIRFGFYFCNSVVCFAGHVSSSGGFFSYETNLPASPPCSQLGVDIKKRR